MSLRVGVNSYLRSSSVAPSTLLRTSSVSSDSLSKVISSLGFTRPKTSLTATLTFSMRSMHPLCSSHQLKLRYLRFVSKSLPYACSKLSSSLFSRLILEPSVVGCGAARDTTDAR
jgi:hypothetical protein